MKKTAFTLVELIVVITILAILATIGFVSFSGYLAGTRDTNRIAQLKSMSDALELYRTKKDLPIPDDKVDVQAGTTTIAYQGYIGSNVLETIEYTEKGLDPKDKTYFSYYLTKNKKYFQLLSFLEEPSEDVLASNTNTDTYTNRNNNIFTSSQAADYSERIPHTKGKKLGILTDENNTPIQEVSAIETAGSLDISDVGTTNYKTIISDEEIITGNGTSLAGMNPIGSCKRIKQIKGSSNDGVYTVDPESDGVGFEVYCDMTTDGGGWTLVTYAGTINGNKTSTTGENGGMWEPLIFKWGSIETDPFTSRKSFSRFDLFKSNARSTDEFMAKRTSVPNNIIIFPVQNVPWFGRNTTEGHFTINAGNRDLPYLKISNSGPDGLKRITNNTKWSYLNSSSSSYPGIDWNVSEGSNCDNCLTNYDTGLSHRSMLYWETGESGYQMTQWFHAQPLSLTDSTGPSNTIQDVEFWWR